MTKKDIEILITDLKWFSNYKNNDAFFAIEFNPNRNCLILMGRYEDVKKICPVLKFDREDESSYWYKKEMKVNGINIEIIAIKDKIKEKK